MRSFNFGQIIDHSAGKRDRDPYPLPCKMLEGRRRRPRALY